MRLGFSIAILSVVFEKVLDLGINLQTERYVLVATTIGFLLSAPMVLFARTSWVRNRSVRHLDSGLRFR